MIIWQGFIMKAFTFATCILEALEKAKIACFVYRFSIKMLKLRLKPLGESVFYFRNEVKI